MTAPESSKTDLTYQITYNLDFVPRRSPKVNVKTVTIENEKKYFMKNHETGTLYDLGEFGNDIWNLIDGKKSVRKIGEELAGTYKGFQYHHLTESLIYFAEEGVLESASQPIVRKRVTIASAFMVKISLIWDSTKFIQSIHRLARLFLRKAFLWPTLAFIAVVGFLFAGNFVSIFVHKENFEILGSTVVGFFFYYFLVLGPAIAIHEIAHGLALVHYGGAPREMGTGLYFFGPMFFIDVTDGWTLSRYQRIMVYAAGPISEGLIGSAIAVFQYLWAVPAPASHILTMAVFYCFYGLLIDLSPLLETDGYHILSDAVKITDLREKSFSYMRKALTSPFRKKIGKKEEALTTRTKVILIVFSVLAVVWAVYLVYRSLLIVTYMGQDTATSILDIASTLISGNPLMITAIILGVASTLYFGMIISGYGLMIFTSLKKAFKTTLHFEEIHDRDLCVFLYLPKNVPQWLFTSLKQKISNVAKQFTQNFTVRQVGSMCIAVLRMSRTKIALVQIKEHFQNIEKKFDMVYESFLKRCKNEILGSVGACGVSGADLTSMLSQMGKQAGRAGISEAKSVCSQIIDRQTRTALYLLHSVYGKVWTVELPPNLLRKIGENLLPTLLVEDLSVTDLYDEAEDFKKRNIYGLDSLAKLAEENQRDLQEALLYPEKYQVISSFEPIRSRLIFVGRTEEIEGMLDSLGSLFVCHVWSGYMDDLLSEVNLSLFALSKCPLPSARSIRLMKDGELVVVERNLSALVGYEKLARESSENLKSDCEFANAATEELAERLKPTERFKVASFNSILRINAENLKQLPTQCTNFEILSRQTYARVKRIKKRIEKEITERSQKTAKKKRRGLFPLPFFMALSLVLAYSGFRVFTDYLSISMLLGAVLLQVVCWAFYFLFRRSFNNVGKYPSLAFRQVHFFAFAFTQSLYKSRSLNILTPTELTTSRSQ